MSKLNHLNVSVKKSRVNNCNVPYQHMNLRDTHNRFKRQLGVLLGIDTYTARDDDKFAIELKKSTEKQINHSLFNQKKFYDASYDYLKLKSEIDQDIVLFNQYGCYKALQGFLMTGIPLYLIIYKCPSLCMGLHEFIIPVLLLFVPLISTCLTTSSFAWSRRNIKKEYNFKQLLSNNSIEKECIVNKKSKGNKKAISE